MAPRRNPAEVWTEERVIEALGEIGRTTRDGFAETVQRLAASVGSTYGGLRNAFRRRGLRPPTFYCAPSAERGEVDVQLESPVPDAPTEPAPEMPPADRTYVERPEVVYRYEPLDLGDELERILIIPDTHAPFHDVSAWAAMMRFARDYKPHTVIHLGDWIDCFTVSDHDRDPRRASQLEEELVVTRELRAEVDSLGAYRKFISLGNHEFRLYTYMVRNAPALLGLLDIAQLLELPQNGWHVVPWMEDAKIGHLRWTHGTPHIGQNAIFQNGTTFGSSIVSGHTHRFAMVYFGDADDGRHVSASLGWLGSRPSAKYMHSISKRRFWQHGFGIANMNRKGQFELQLKPIIHGEVLA